MDQVGLDAGQRLPLNQDGEGLVFLRSHQTAEPRLLRELRRGVRREVHLLGTGEQLATMKSGTAQEGVLDRGQSRSPVVGARSCSRVRRSGRRHADRDDCEGQTLRTTSGIAETAPPPPPRRTFPNRNAARSPKIITFQTREGLARLSRAKIISRVKTFIQP